ncbi:hypothetical protein [Sulfurimonas sp. NWX367]|uniref:hypothetical protein n=1 Tax=Sulfurimonas sp. NWX367 TaxID=2925413 RepID=UPI003204F1B4
MSINNKYILSNGKDVYISKYKFYPTHIDCSIFVPEFGKTLSVDMTYQYLSHVERENYPCPDGSRCTDADIVYGYVGSIITGVERTPTNFPDKETIISHILDRISDNYYNIFHYYSCLDNNYFIVYSSLDFGIDYSVFVKVCYLNANYRVDGVNYCTTDYIYPNSKFLLRGFTIVCCCLPDFLDTKLSDIYSILGGN